MPEPSAISDNCYYNVKDDKPCYLDKSGKEQTIEGIDDGTNVTNIATINGYALIDSENSQYLFKESDKTTSKLTDTYDIAAIKGDQVIIRTGDTPAYEKKAVSELENSK